MTGRLRALWELPRPGGATGPAPRDWLLVAVVVVAAVVEGLLRTDVAARGLEIVLVATIAFTLPWRRVHPLAMVALAMGLKSVVVAVIVTAGGSVVGLSAGVFVLILVYAGFRWGSGREAFGTVGVLAVVVLLGFGRDYRSLAELLPELAILSLPVMAGITVRAQSASRARELEQVRASERVQLARDLHDTVAHHVSAMVVRAQAGRVVAPTDPDAAVDALRAIEAEGSRTLREMRAIVGALRETDGPVLAPTASLRDIEGLARDRAGGISVEVTIEGDVDDVNPGVAAALYRIAQESVTNASRHAEGATRVDVRVTAEPDAVRLRVQDDGAAATPTGTGFGIVGMRERAALLGGSVDAGPADGGGWFVDAVLPRTGEGR